jgi:glycine oxidase
MPERLSSRSTGDRVAVVGGGVIGLACARRLRLAGARVILVDPDVLNRQAGWAAGGMLAPLAEATSPGPFLQMARRSLQRYPAFVASLERSTGIRLGLHLNGKLLTAYDDTRAQELRGRLAWLGPRGGAVEWIDGDGARLLEPALSPEVRGGLLLRGNGRVDNRALLRALRADCRARGVEFVRDRVTAVETLHGRVTGVRLASGGPPVPATAAVVAAGAWSGEIQGLPRAVPVRPVQGQMLALASPDRPLVRVVTAGDRYLIPRESPRGPVIVVGATEEEVGFDVSLDAAAQASLQEAAIRLVPALRAVPVVERWAGLRPGTPDGTPILGPDPQLPDLCYATGHHRNGILLAPVTAHRVAGWWQDRG